MNLFQIVQGILRLGVLEILICSPVILTFLWWVDLKTNIDQ